MPILVEQALEMACSASTKSQMAHMKGEDCNRKELTHSYLFRCTVTIWRTTLVWCNVSAGNFPIHYNWRKKLRLDPGTAFETSPLTMQTS